MITDLQKLDVKARIGQHYFRLKASREDLEQNYPHKVDLINNLVSAEEDIDYVKTFIRLAFDELHLVNRRNYDLELINLKLIARCKELELLNKSLVNRVNI